MVISCYIMLYHVISCYIPICGACSRYSHLKPDLHILLSFASFDSGWRTLQRCRPQEKLKYSVKWTTVNLKCFFFVWLKDAEGNAECQSHNDHSGQDSHVLPALDQVVQPCANGTHDQKESPILHQVLGHHTTITTYPIADVLTIHLVAHVILDSFDDGVEKQRRRDVEKLSRSPNVIHGQPNHFVGLHTG